ncbi:lasso peptide biosynthesis B2 protein [Ilumatobacter sp.]|uniref:lasso peptide biosynthesis B2 protein n=1 Tax=Ilumatobacter sp. TaxID=1967498 RepID=UPI003B52BC71
MTASRPGALRRLAELRPLDVAQVVVVAAQLARAEALLRLRPVDRVAAAYGMLFDEEGPAQTGPVALSDAERRWLHNATRMMLRWPLDRSCLRRSLTLGWILRRRRPELVIGTRLDDGVLAAHAWVRLGTIDLDPSATEHVRFD